MISVVIPLFNKEEYIAKTLQSVLNQTYTTFELLVINDGSTDNSLGIVNGIEDSRLRVVTLPHGGVSVARNKGIELAQYPWIAFLDADDYWSPVFLEEMIKATQAYPEEGVFASGRSRVFMDNTERYEHELLPAEGKTGRLDYFQVISRYLPPINSSSSLIKKELFSTEAKFRPGQRKHEDHDLWIRLCKNREVIFVNSPLSYYCKTHSHATSQDYYDASDFCTYLKTLSEVSTVISGKKKKWFQRYLNKFILITYLQNYKGYSKQEEQMVFERARNMMDGPNGFLLKILKFLPFKLYGLLKFFKG
ncbi:MAG: glycosyltransferase family 2 protein [Bacteroidota bacterium]